MRKVLFLAVFACAVILTGCEKVLYKVESPYQYYLEDGRLRLVDNHLHFVSVEDLSAFLDELDEDGRVATKSSGATGVVFPDGFVSVRNRKDGLALTKADGGDQMSADEFAVYRAEALLVEPKLQYVMDTAMVIGAGDYTYKVIDEGTLMVPSKMSDGEMASMVGRLDRAGLALLAKGEVKELDGGVRFIRTFGEEVSIDEFDVSVEEDAETKGYVMSNNLHSGYNVTTYTWKGSSLLQKFLELLLIKDLTQYVYIDNNRRVSLQFYNNNFGFIEAAGLRTQLQVKKWFLFVPYWVSDGGSYSFVNGFNYLYSKHANYMQNTGYASYQPGNFNGYSVKAFSFSGIGTVNFLYGKCTGVPYLSNWGSDYTFVLPELKMSGVSVTDETKSILDKLYNVDTCPPRQLLSTLRSCASARGRTDKPSMLFIPHGSGHVNFKEDITMLCGVNEVYGTEYVTRLLSKGGFSWSGGIPAPIQFSIYDISAVDSFGAVRYKNKWYGVRFVFEN